MSILRTRAAEPASCSPTLDRRPSSGGCHRSRCGVREATSSVCTACVAVLLRGEYSVLSRVPRLVATLRSASRLMHRTRLVSFATALVALSIHAPSGMALLVKYATFSRAKPNRRIRWVWCDTASFQFASSRSSAGGMGPSTLPLPPMSDASGMAKLEPRPLRNGPQSIMKRPRFHYQLPSPALGHGGQTHATCTMYH